jgi:putative oxidoreductase
MVRLVEMQESTYLVHSEYRLRHKRTVIAAVSAKLRPMRSKARKYALWIAIALVVLYVGAGGAAKLAGVPYVHSSFPKMGLPGWFGYFIGTCEVLGCIGLLIRPLRDLAALGIGVIMVGATYYHATYTPILRAAPAFVLVILSGYIFWTARSELLSKSRTTASLPL